MTARTLPLVRPLLPPPEALTAAVADVLASGVLTNDGPRVRLLETLLASHLQAAHLAVCASGTTALQLACAALDMAGEVIVPAAAFPAVVQAVRRAGGTPVAVDVEDHYLTIDPAAVRAAVTHRTTGIVAVHTFGCCADINALTSIARLAGVPLIFDAATCWGVWLQDRPLAALGEVVTLSLHATKLMHAVEGGAVVTDGPDVAAAVRRLRGFGIGPGGALDAGTNARMSELHAAVGALVLEETDNEIGRRMAVRAFYEARLEAIEWVRPFALRPGAGPNVATMAVSLSPDAPLDATAVCDRLARHGINARAYFAGRYRPCSVPSVGGTPIAEAAARQILCLPFWGHLREQDVVRVVQTLAGCERRPANRRTPPAASASYQTSTLRSSKATR